MSKTILIVEDEKELLEGMVGLFREQDFVVHQASDGLIALNILQNNLIDIVLSDIKMPGLDGLALLKKVRTEFSRQPKFYLMSGGNPYDISDFLLLGINAYFDKPLDIFKVLKRIKDDDSSVASN